MNERRPRFSGDLEGASAGDSGPLFYIIISFMMLNYKNLIKKN